MYPKVEAALRAVIAAQLPEGIDWAMNLGKFDFFPAASGKGNVVKYLQEKFGVSEGESVCLFDDDNDLPMARRCGTCMLPGLTSASVRRAALEHPDWRVATKVDQGVFAIEELLEELLAHEPAERSSALVDVLLQLVEAALAPWRRAASLRRRRRGCGMYGVRGRHTRRGESPSWGGSGTGRRSAGCGSPGTGGPRGP